MFLLLSLEVLQTPLWRLNPQGLNCPQQLSAIGDYPDRRSDYACDRLEDKIL